MNDTMGIDISKDTLDTFWLSNRKHKQFATTKTGLRSLIRWVRKAEVSLVVFEATGVYHRLLETSLAAHDFPFARVNPRQARRFAEGTGTLAKTDRVDAEMLARMGSLLELQADKPKSKTLHNLKGMTTARQALIKDRTAAKARLATATYPLLRKQATLRLRQIERDVAQIDEAIAVTIAADKTLSVKADILVSIPGIAKVTAFAMLVDPLMICPANHCRAVNARTGQLERKTGCELGRSRADLTSIRKVARQRTHPGRTRMFTKSHLLTGCGRHPLQPGYESKIRRSDCQRKMQETGDYSGHAKARGHGKCAAT